MATRASENNSTAQPIPAPRGSSALCHSHIRLPLTSTNSSSYHKPSKQRLKTVYLQPLASIFE